MVKKTSDSARILETRGDKGAIESGTVNCHFWVILVLSLERTNPVRKALPVSGHVTRLMAKVGDIPGGGQLRARQILLRGHQHPGTSVGLII